MSTEAKETGPEMLQRLGTDAMLWAQEFNKTAMRLGYSEMDEGWLVGWFANAIENTCMVRKCQTVRDQLAEAQAVAIKPLEWKHDFAHTNFVSYYHLSRQVGDVSVVLEKNQGSMTTKSFWHTENEAKSAAQADYEARIRSALVTPQPSEAPNA